MKSLEEEVELYEFAGQKKAMEEAYIGEIGEISCYRRGEFGILEHDPYNLYGRPNKRITYQVLKGSRALIDGI
jgi:hypothetical protein